MKKSIKKASIFKMFPFNLFSIKRQGYPEHEITECKETERTLLQSEEYYRTLVEESFDGIFIQKGPKIIFANQRLHEMLGYDRGELEGMDHWLVYHPDYQDLTRERARARMEGKNPPSRYEVKLLRKDGSSLDGEINARRIMFCNEPGIQVWVRDIIERKRTENALRRSEEAAKRLAAENAVMARIGRIIGSSLDINEVYEQFGKEVRKIIPFDRILINNVNPESNTFTSAYVMGVDVDGRPPGAVIRWSGSATQETYHSQASLLIQTEDRDELASRFPALLPHFQVGLRSFMAVPLISKGNVIGVLHFQSATPNAYSETDLRLAERVGNQIAGAIANAQLFSERNKAEEEQRKLILQLQDALARVKTLGGLIPICSSCKKIRDDKGYWNQLETYIHDRSEAEFSHGICPECSRKLYPFLHEEEDKEKK